MREADPLARLIAEDDTNGPRFGDDPSYRVVVENRGSESTPDVLTWSGGSFST